MDDSHQLPSHLVGVEISQARRRIINKKAACPPSGSHCTTRFPRRLPPHRPQPQRAQRLRRPPQLRTSHCRRADMPAPFSTGAPTRPAPAAPWSCWRSFWSSARARRRANQTEKAFNSDVDCQFSALTACYLRIFASPTGAFTLQVLGSGTGNPGHVVLCVQTVYNVGDHGRRGGTVHTATILTTGVGRTLPVQKSADQVCIQMDSGPAA